MNTFLLSLSGLAAAEVLYLLAGRILARWLAERLVGGDFDCSVRGMSKIMANVATTFLLLISLRVVWRPIKEAHTIKVIIFLAALAFLFSFVVLMLRGVMICLIRRREEEERNGQNSGRV